MLTARRGDRRVIQASSQIAATQPCRPHTGRPVTPARPNVLEATLIETDVWYGRRVRRAHPWQEPRALIPN